MKYSIPLLLLCTSTLNGCMVGPDFQHPDVVTQTHYNTDADLLNGDQRLAIGQQIQAQWWTLFASKSLNDVIQQALQNNHDLAAAKETVAQANEFVQAERGGLLPQVAMTGTVGRQKYGAALFGPADFSIPPFTYYELGPEISWSPDLAGGKKRGIERQQAMAEYQLHQLDAAYVSLTAQVVQQTLAIATAQSEIAITQQLINEDEKNLKLVQTALQGGVATQVDVLTAQSQLDADRATLPALKQKQSIAQHALAILVGSAPADWTPPNFSLNDFHLPQQLPLSLPSELVRQRPDILSAEANLHAASATIGVATANLYPQVNLTGNILQEALTPSGLLKSVNSAWALAAGLTAPMYQGGRLTAEKHAAEHGYQAALAQYKQTILQSFAQVADSLQALQHDHEEFEAQQQAVNTAHSFLQLSRKSYQAGSTGVLPVEDATRQAYRTQLGLVRSQGQRLADTAQLFTALGGSPVQQSHDTPDQSR
ncbi:efflux transporter outer membrane subunit [Acinetobacter sp. VNH17]|uniref:Efflux transporter outer membrane subunit n=1 Tax=Acinetobacter thutiue TaxID=2998078 RepID=A0ABT7WPZ5_9GAMM|nr:efflux transporter outer membrane subunit [Acinetobacter thutiue]MCY6412639.1 efflux transporter outer membrane subunit [Acinetobacter thutiue]MDN0014746.1 efflux transporter outer membrane subunit [Acinetobacter thutiue]